MYLKSVVTASFYRDGDLQFIFLNNILAKLEDFHQHQHQSELKPKLVCPYYVDIGGFYPLGSQS